MDAGERSRPGAAGGMAGWKTAFSDLLDTLMVKVYSSRMVELNASLKVVERSPVDYTSRMYWSGIIKMSLSKFFILSVLREQPMHGYEIARAVECSTQGCCAPTEGTIYPVLREFEQGDYVTVHTETVAGRGRKVYTLTDKGRQAFAVAMEAWMEVSTHIHKHA